MKTQGIINKSAVPLSSLKHFSIFLLIVLVLQATVLLFWFTLTTLINLISGESRELFSVNKMGDSTLEYSFQFFSIRPCLGSVCVCHTVQDDEESRDWQFSSYRK